MGTVDIAAGAAARRRAAGDTATCARGKLTQGARDLAIQHNITELHCEAAQLISITGFVKFTYFAIFPYIFALSALCACYMHCVVVGGGVFGLGLSSDTHFPNYIK